MKPVKPTATAPAGKWWISVMPKGIRYLPSTTPVSYTVIPDPPAKR